MKTKTAGNVTIRCNRDWDIDATLPIRVRAKCESCGTEQVIESSVRLSNRGDGLLQVMCGGYLIEDKCPLCKPDDDGIRPWMTPIPVSENIVLDLTQYQDENSTLQIPWD